MTKRKTLMCHKMAEIAVKLQHIIYAHWHLCENKDKAGIQWSKDGVSHQKAVFCLLAFRTLLMYVFATMAKKR